MEMIQLGSSGEEVKLLQKALSELTGTRLSFDGQFGELSRKTLMQYQEANGITPTGVYDSVTMFMLNHSLVRSIFESLRSTNMLIKLVLIATF